MSKGTLKADELKVARITVNFLTQPMKVQAMFALVDSKTGSTLSWSQLDGSAWSDETKSLLRQLCLSMEDDAARHLFSEFTSVPTAIRPAPPPGGISEHLGNGDADAPSI